MCTVACGAANSPHRTAATSGPPTAASPRTVVDPASDPTSHHAPTASAASAASSEANATVAQIQFHACVMSPAPFRDRRFITRAVFAIMAGASTPGHARAPAARGGRGSGTVRGNSADEAPHRGDRADGVDARHLHHVTGRGCVHHLAVADVDADVADRAVEADQVARLQFGSGHRATHPGLLPTGVPQAYASRLVGVLDQPGAVERVRPG